MSGDIAPADVVAARDLPNAVFDAFRGITDHAWLDILVRSCCEPIIDGTRMPGFPNISVQQRIHGADGEMALREGFAFFSEIKAYAAFCGRPVEHHRKLLDFGCGWGRIVRMFMKDISAQNLFATDPHAEFLAIARRCNVAPSFIWSTDLPPLPLASSLLDYVTAWSVFSHLDEHLANAWIAEFSRLLKPGGLIFISTQSVDFLDFCESLRQRSLVGETFEHEWHQALTNAFVDLPRARADLQAGAFLFAATRGSPPDPSARYGEAIISRHYVEACWTGTLRLVAFIDDPVRLPQALIVLQKPLDAEPT